MSEPAVVANDRRLFFVAKGCMAALIATVAVAAPLDKPLSYLIPAALHARARVGVRVRIPLGRRRAIGYILELTPGPEEGLKPVDEILDAAPLFPADLIPFLQRAGDYYRHPIGEVVRTALPAGLSGESDRVGILTETFYRSAGSGEPAGPRQREILAYLRAHGAASASALSAVFPAPHGVLRRLVELGHVATEVREKVRDPFFAQPAGADRSVAPTDEQHAALAQIEKALDAGDFAPFLLHGVTGSGKTEVYLRAIAAGLEKGRQALVLVPEIALTPQLVARFRARFHGRAAIAVLHSGLSDGERFDAWRSIARGAVQIVIGARSAVFAPLPDPGILVVDEEHEASYKQSEGFRYNARDLALLRAQMSKAVVLLGSATPALTTYHRAQGGQTGYLRLSGRILARSLPSVELVDLTQERPEGSLSEPLAGALTENLARGEQSLVLLNRRGFAPFLLCTDCGTTFRCPNCEITLTYYQGRRKLLCHYCDFVQHPPDLCPGCKGLNLAPEGAGTERLEEELAALLPQARIGRMDRDTTVRKGAHRQLIERMEKKEIDILLGTQMVAKGHDFPGVTLVGVIGADSSLNFPDFRSAERTFALLTQVAGRAGRGERPGKVLIQTWAPDHYALACAARHDYEAFYREEIALRGELGYPPFGHLVNLVFSGLDAEKVNRAAGQIASALEEAAGGTVEVLGPAPCPLAKLRGKTRMQVLLKSPQRSALHRLLGYLVPLRRKIPAGTALAVDVDPLDML